MKKKILYKIAMFLLLFFVLNLVYTKWFYESDLQKQSDIINLVRDIPDDADIIYIGESSNITYKNTDIDKRPISSFIGDYYPGLKMYHITKPASHAGIYKVLLVNIPNENKAKTLIVTLNLRSFNAQWIYSKLETSLQKSLVLIKDYPPFLNRFLLSFKNYDIKTEKERNEQVHKKWINDTFNLPFKFQFSNVVEWDNWMAKTGKKTDNGSIDTMQTQLASHYIKAYAFQIDTVNNPRIADFDAIVELAKKHNWNIVFNLLAENIQKAQELVGDELIYMMNENVEILKSYYTKRGVQIVDNLSVVNSEEFIDKNWTTEHYKEKGRKLIAKNVAEVLRTWHENEFSKVSYEHGYQTVFFNNCDTDLIWGQLKSITSERAFSGNKSSVTGAGNDYSIGLEYPINIIPDSLKSIISIEFMMFQESLAQDAKLVLQASGKEFKDYWVGFSLKGDMTETNKWQNYRQTVAIPDSIKNAEVYKVYVYNPTQEKIYIDDFKIEIE